MTEYVKSTNFASKDALAIGNPLKIVKGTEIDTEFNNIATAVATKADLVSPVLTGTPQAPTAASGTNTTQLATTAYVIAALQAVYPVGSIYINAASTTNPSTLLGFGTWTAFGAGKVLIGQDTGDASFDVLEETGGSKDAIVVAHTHTTDTQGSHQHYAASSANAGAIQSGSNVNSGNYISTNTGTSGLNEAYNFSATGSGADVGLTSASGSHSHNVNSTGSSGTNANLQPYVVVKMWKRAA